MPHQARDQKAALEESRRAQATMRAAEAAGSSSSAAADEPPPPSRVVEPRLTLEERAAQERAQQARCTHASRVQARKNAEELARQVAEKARQKAAEAEAKAVELEAAARQEAEDLEAARREYTILKKALIEFAKANRKLNGGVLGQVGVSKEFRAASKRRNEILRLYPFLSSSYTKRSSSAAIR